MGASVIGHGIVAGNYPTKCRNLLSSSPMYAGDRQLPGHSKACGPQNSKGDGKDTPITLYWLSYVERSDPSTRATIHQLLKVSCWNQCRHMRMYVFGLIMTSFLSDRVCRLSYSFQTTQLTSPENTHALRDHVEFYVSTTSSSSVETSFKSFKLDHNFHFEISLMSMLPRKR